MGFKGPAWTYSNKQQGSANVRARLDRCVASPEWSDYFKHATVQHICSSRSDHLPVLLKVGSRKEWRAVGPNVNSSFRYEQMWERVESLQTTIAATWRENGPAENLLKVCSKLKQMQTDLSSWAARDFGSVIKKTAEIRARLNRIWSSPLNPEKQIKADHLARELDELLLREELMWR